VYFIAPGRWHLTVKIIYGAMIVSVVIFIGMAYSLVPSLGLEIFDAGDTTLWIIEYALGSVALLTLLLAAFFPRGTVRVFNGARRPAPDALTFTIIRVSFFEATGIYGLILAMLGADTAITLPFFLVSLAALVLTFPTRERWRKISGESDDRPGPVS
jgi:F0F1-type ATP synthase membrane subunit c/vacuolar-type H+-ATPase subunit K